MRILQTALGLGMLLVAQTVDAALISEFQPNPPGGDPAQASFELSGDALQNFSFVIGSIDTDPSSTGGFGTLDRLAAVSGTFDALGLAVVTIPDLENPSFTVFLAESINASIGDSLDTDGDGNLDNLAIFTGVEDAISINDDANNVTASLYATQLGGTEFEFTGDEPGLIFRAGSTGDWFAINDPFPTATAFAADGSEVPFASFSSDPSVTTFGAINPTVTAVPEPSSIACLAVLGAGGVYRRVRRKKVA